ncbi:hypothetical protein [Stenotrophomonas maltophilia]|uniref:hypothetical protein n=1 Tax=Stenotrophomonas maltophilia TaxID=40324 RepID=UPI000C15D3F7|nr:hypothetical protein [Stenotrophomonas maltophilia]
MKDYLVRNESAFNLEDNAFAFFRQANKSKRDERRTLKQRYDRKAPKESPEDFLILGVWE